MATFSITNTLKVTGNFKVHFEADAPPVDTFYLLDDETNMLIDDNNNLLTSEED